jgi:hypothetical protein
MKNKSAVGLALSVLVAGSLVGFAVRRHHRAEQRNHEAAEPAAAAGRPTRSSEPPAGGGDNPNVRSVREAQATRTHPERLSPLIAPLPFDKESFENDPKAYLDVVEPGRCFRTAKATGPETPPLLAASSLAPRTEPGGKAWLMVRGVPNAPVTFTAFSGGHFAENTLNSISVRADARGYAGVNFVAPGGIRSRFAVLVGSPLAVGNQRFFVDTVGSIAAN